MLLHFDLQPFDVKQCVGHCQKCIFLHYVGHCGPVDYGKQH